MSHDHSSHSGNLPTTSGKGRTASRWIFWGFVLVALYFLITEHRAHVLPYLPILLLLACPLMHLFHHGRHGHGGDPGKADEQRDSGPDAHQH
jgi:hypothetical protein